MSPKTSSIICYLNTTIAVFFEDYDDATVITTYIIILNLVKGFLTKSGMRRRWWRRRGVHMHTRGSFVTAVRVLTRA